MDQWCGLPRAAHKKARPLGQLAVPRIRASFALKAQAKYRPMDDKPENVPVQPDLTASLRQARVENAERAEAVADLRDLEIVRLRALESALHPVVDQAPPGVDLFDMALAPGEHPRLFLDMVAYVDLARDKRTYRFYQDTRHGRMLIADNQSVEVIVAAVADYVGRRLVERERALATDWRPAASPQSEPRPTELNGPATWPIAKPRVRTLPFPPAAASDPFGPADQSNARRQRGIGRRLGDAFSLFLMLLGSITFALMLGIGGYWAWTARLRDLWAQWIGAPPF
jgi:hypothetical protein